MAGISMDTAKVIEWIAERFREKREWAAEDLYAACESAGFDKESLWIKDVRELPIRRRLHPRERRWTWRAAEGWPD